MISFYIHIPFCKRKCAYCDFLSGFDVKDTQKYVDALLNEISSFKTDKKIKSIFIGGGTPSVIDSRYTAEIMRCVKDNFTLVSDCEISIETNPGTLDEEKLSAYKNAGINRLSMGIQSFDDALLKTLGRIHDSRTARDNFALAKKYFDNINMDLMFALPDQSLDNWRNTLKTAVLLEPTHISAYSLIIEENTPFYDKYTSIDENIDREMYYYAKKFLSENGYIQYEISNFAKQGYECRHNLVYWQGGDYKGFGLGAASLINNFRLKNTDDMRKYLNGIYVVESLGLDMDDQMKEFVILGLRCTDGIDTDLFKARFNADIYDIFGETLDKHIHSGLLKKHNNMLKLTEKGIDLSNMVFVDII